MRGTPENFRMVSAEQESWEMKPVLSLLGRTLAKALGREVPKVRSKSI